MDIKNISMLAFPLRAYFVKYVSLAFSSLLCQSTEVSLIIVHHMIVYKC